MRNRGPIIAPPGTKMGRLAPGTRLAVRKITDAELAIERKRLARISCSDIKPHRWLVVWADQPTKVLKDFFVPVGGATRGQALTQAHRYAMARGAVVVELDWGEKVEEPEFDDGVHSSWGPTFTFPSRDRGPD